MGSPTRFTYGVSTQPKGSFAGDYPLPDPFMTGGTKGKEVYTYANDFVDLGNNASRVIVGTNSTFALTDGVNGLGILTPGAGTTASAVHRAAASFQFIEGKKLWCVHRIKMSSVAGNTVFYFGLTKVSGGTLATTDRLVFSKAAASTSLNLVSTVNNTATTLVTGAATVANDTFITAGYYYDGKDLQVFVDGALVARVQDVTVGASGTTLTNALLSPIFGMTPVSGETVTIDYAMVAQETSR